MGRPVAVMGLDGDNGEHIMVVVCLDPPEAYTNKNGKHAGFIVAAKVVPEKDTPKLSEREHTAIIRAHFALKVALENAYAAPPADPFS
jgi:hypothetical protein